MASASAVWLMMSAASAVEITHRARTVPASQMEQAGRVTAAV